MKTLPLRHLAQHLIFLMLSLTWLAACARPELAASPTPLVELVVTAPAVPTSTAMPQPTPTPTVTPTPSPLPSPTPARLSLTALQNITYTLYSMEGWQVKLTDGVYDDSAGDIPYYVQLDPRSPIYDDLNGDGLEDALVLIYTHAGLSGQYLDLIWVVNRNGQPEPAKSISLGDRGKINSITIDENGVTLDLLTHGPNDGSCCPTVSKREHYNPLPR
jgi:hypothetical protein